MVPAWYGNLWIVVPVAGSSLALLLVAVVSSRRYYHSRHEARILRDQMLEQERAVRATLEESNAQSGSPAPATRPLDDHREAEHRDRDGQVAGVRPGDDEHRVAQPQDEDVGHQDDQQQPAEDIAR